MSTLRQLLTYEPAELGFGTSGLRAPVADMTDLECYINTVGFLQFLLGKKHLALGGTVHLAGDLRDSTPRIMRAVHRAITDCGFETMYHGLIPTPALAYYALSRRQPGIVVTGSHIPADRNGIKFYKPNEEVLKEDEPDIKAAIADVRAQVYGMDTQASFFDAQGTLLRSPALPKERSDARNAFRTRYVSTFGVDVLKDKTIVFYQHSSVGRDLLADLFRALGANVIAVGRSDVFVPIDSENVTPENREYFKQLAAQHPGRFAIVSTDGDSDRPFVIDEKGHFHNGDMLGAVVAEWCGADFAAYPVSASDAVDTSLTAKRVPYEHTKIGSPYVVSAMKRAADAGKRRVVGWEVNGGFLLGSDLVIGGGVLEALPTRDAFFPILVALLSAKGKGLAVSELFAQLPDRHSRAGLIDNFPVAVSQALLQHFKDDTPENRETLETFFTRPDGFGNITKIDSLDGIRIFFDNGDIAHIRPSNNAPQLRIYAIADTEERINEIIAHAVAQNGIFERLAAAISAV